VERELADGGVGRREAFAQVAGEEQCEVGGAGFARREELGAPAREIPAAERRARDEDRERHECDTELH
jgi:hypothetical protein